MAGLSTGLVEVGISMVLRDNFSTEAGRVSNSYVSMLNNMQQANRALTQGLGNAFEYGKQLTGGMYESYKQSAAVNNQIFMTSKIAGATAQQQLDIMKRVQDINRQTPLTNMDIASGARYLAMAGNSVSRIEAMLGPAAKLASIFDMQLGNKGGVADLMTNIMATFGLSSDKAEEVADTLAVAVTSSNMNLVDLAQALQYSGSIFRNANVDLAQAAAAIGVLGDQGIQASSAGTALANMVRYLTLSIAGQKVKGTNWLQKLGLSKEDLTDAHGNLIRIDRAMDLLRARMATLDTITKEQAMYNIFGVRGERATYAIMNSDGKMTQLIHKLGDAEGTVNSLIEERLQTSQGKLDQFRAAIDNLNVGFGKLVSGPFNALLTQFTKLINWVGDIVSSKGIGAWLVQTTAISIAVGTVVNGFKLVYHTLKTVVATSYYFNTTIASANTGTRSMVSSTVALEAHLRTVVALMMQYTAMSMAAGTSMMLPMGGRLGRDKSGKIYASFKGNKYVPGGYANRYTGGANVKPTVAPKPMGGAPKPIGGLGKVLGAGLFMFGGWQGLLITGLLAFLPTIIEAISGNTNAQDVNTQATRENTEGMSNQEFRAFYEERFLNAVRAAFKEGNKDPAKVSISLDGSPYRDINSGDVINIDTWGIFN